MDLGKRFSSNGISVEWSLSKKALRSIRGTIGVGVVWTSQSFEERTHDCVSLVSENAIDIK